MPKVTLQSEPDRDETSFPGWTVDLRPGQALLVGRDPSDPAVAGRAAALGSWIRPRQVVPLGANCRLSRAQLAIGWDRAGILRAFNLGHARHPVGFQPYGARAAEMPVTRLAAPASLGHGFELGYATTLWLPSTGDGHPARKLTVLHPAVFRNGADSPDTPGGPRRTGYGDSLRWPLPAARSEALFALAAPLLRFPPHEPYPRVATLRGTLDVNADDLVRRELKPTYPEVAVGRNAETIELLFTLGDLTLQRLHEAYHASRSAGVRTALQDAAKLYEALAA